MKTVDHRLLGEYLLEHFRAPRLSCRRAFLLGCVEPDYNVFSYLRGGCRFEKLRGHNAENSAAFLARCAADFDRNGVFSSWDYFRLGVMLHYAADAFTAPHNGFWTGTLREHRAYEAELHGKFETMLASVQLGRLPCREYASLHEAYRAQAPGTETDFRYILTACASLMKKYLLPAEAEGACHEGPDYDRLVPAGH